MSILEKLERLPLGGVARSALDLVEGDLSDLDPFSLGVKVEASLSKKERHKLGAHFTPRAYVERLVKPTLEEPLREEWEVAKAEGPVAIQAFHEKLCATKVLDPACGSGNFLVVVLDTLMDLEVEVLSYLPSVRPRVSPSVRPRVSPAQTLGIEVKAESAAIAALVLWLRYYQRGGEEVPLSIGNIECRDALLAWDGEPVMRKGEDGKPLTRWNPAKTKVHPVTGKDVPDDTARIPIWDYPNARAAEWPKADYIVGNPPFLGNKRMRDGLGDGYVDALRMAWPAVSSGADLVMYWWHHAASLVGSKRVLRSGLITTNSITQSSNRAVVAEALKSSSLAFAVPDHPWVDSVNGAAVRVAMSVLVPGRQRKGSVAEALPGDEMRIVAGEVALAPLVTGIVQSGFSLGANSSEVASLASNLDMSFMGVILVGNGFILEANDPICAREPQALRAFMNGKDLAQTSRKVSVIDFWGLSEEDAMRRFPQAYQRLLDTVKPERDSNRDRTFRESWWLHGRGRPEMRDGLLGLHRYVGICRTAKHFVFQFLRGEVLAESTIVAIATNDAFHLAAMSSRVHVVFALQAGGELVDRPRYLHNATFEPFPFPDPSDALKQRIRDLGERLDAHRKARQAKHPELTITGMYNVLEALRAERALTAKEKLVHEQGLVSILKQIHDELDAAVFEAYNWDPKITDQELLQKLTDLNHERAEEEKRGLIRWLRPEYQKPKWEKKQAKKR